ncbi:thymidine kinase, putative [Bodo saltans]|uniref:Thymidine kinase n=1 Tax=Bodo saltans TaxID=75058 RepID=A0A0S4JEG8_BODSA|nr:thymidine kinase, putative [Bodo saltans]|eukprot:CUG89967.1 thymidine kinase, putative [Bodo saltans]
MPEGRIELIIGPMFAGKTTELMRRVKREIHARRLCFVIKYCQDSRYSKDHVASHDKVTLRAKASVSKLSEVGDEWKYHEVIAVDEGQFFPDLLDFCRIASDAGKTVIVSALDGDFLRKPFGHVCELVPMCESVMKLTAVCMMCHTKEASFTRRTVASDAQELIGGADMYIATCRECFLNPVPPSPARMVRVRDAIRDVERATTSTDAPAPQRIIVEESDETETSADVSPKMLNLAPPPFPEVPVVATKLASHEITSEPALKKARCESPP